MRVWLLFAFVTTLACGTSNGKIAIDGSCDLSVIDQQTDAGPMIAMGWLCTSSVADASRFLPACSGQNVAGAGCMVDSTTDNGSSTQPMHLVGPAPECVDCPNGNGTDWVCGSQGWEAVGVYTCKH